jgi:hypothetical protein
MNPVPLIVNVVANAPAVNDVGEMELMLGTGFKTGGCELPPSPPPPHPARKTIDKRKMQAQLRTLFRA